jgi:hypothetical protein
MASQIQGFDHMGEGRDLVETDGTVLVAALRAPSGDDLGVPRGGVCGMLPD